MATVGCSDAAFSDFRGDHHVVARLQCYTPNCETNNKRIKSVSPKFLTPNRFFLVENSCASASCFHAPAHTQPAGHKSCLLAMRRCPRATHPLPSSVHNSGHSSTSRAKKTRVSLTPLRMRITTHHNSHSYSHRPFCIQPSLRY